MTLRCPQTTMTSRGSTMTQLLHDPTMIHATLTPLWPHIIMFLFNRWVTTSSRLYKTSFLCRFPRDTATQRAVRSIFPSDRESRRLHSSSCPSALPPVPGNHRRCTGRWCDLAHLGCSSDRRGDAGRERWSRRRWWDRSWQRYRRETHWPSSYAEQTLCSSSRLTVRVYECFQSFQL